MKLSAIFALVFPLACAAGPAPPPLPVAPINSNSWAGVEFTTNWFARNAHWRASQGIIYNTSFSRDWNFREGTCLEVLGGLALIEHRWKEPRYHIQPGYTVGPPNHGNMLGGGTYRTPANKTKIGDDEKVERYLIIHAPAELLPGWKVDRLLSIRVEHELFRGELLPVYDCGTAPTAAEIERLKQKFANRRRPTRPGKR
jgi:hypothetical protein